MRSIAILCAVGIIMYISACSKTDNPTRVTPPGPDTIPVKKGNGLLRKTLSTGSSLDSVTNYYYYNPDNTLSQRHLSGYDYHSGSLRFGYGGATYYRDQNGRLLMIAQIDAPETDSSYTFFFYTNAADKSASYTISKSEISGTVHYDSTLFSYNPAGFLIRNYYYHSHDWPGIAAEKTDSYWLYEWDVNGNRTTKELHSLYPGSPVVDSIILGVSYTYDTNISAFAGLFTGYEEPTRNNVIGQTSRLAGPYSGGYSESYGGTTYQYDSKGRPRISSQLSANHPPDSVRTYYYYND